jgi:hypothetical protein
MIDDLASPTGECYMAPGVDVLSKYIKQGIRFTWPTLTQGEQPHRPDPPLPAQNWLLKGGGEFGVSCSQTPDRVGSAVAIKAAPCPQTAAGLKILTIGSMQAQGIWWGSFARGAGADNAPCL